jgi:adenylate cyclase
VKESETKVATGIKAWLKGETPRELLEQRRKETEKLERFDRLRIAVLPLANLSPDPSDEYFADGLTEELIDRLSQMKGFEVIARTSVMSYKKKDKKISEIGKELRVGTIVEGSLRKAGNRIRVTVDVVDVSTEGRLWSSRYDRDLEDIFAIQSDIASKVVGCVPTTLGLSGAPTALSKETEDVVAYSYFLQGRELLHQTPEKASLWKALSLFEKSTEIDPKFARGYVGVALAYRFLGFYGHIPFINAIEKAKASLGKALAINKELSEAHSALGAVEIMEDDDDAAEIELRRAIEINPNLADAYSSLADMMIAHGNLNESIRLREKAYELDPLEPWNLSSLGDEYFYAGRNAEALKIWKISVKLAPYLTYDGMLEYYIHNGEYDRASSVINELQKLDSKNPENNFWAGYLAATMGDRAKAEQEIAILQQSAKEGSVSMNGIAIIYSALGDMDAFFEYASRALDLHVISVGLMRFSPLLAKAREDPRMSELLGKYERISSKRTVSP